MSNDTFVARVVHNRPLIGHFRVPPGLCTKTRLGAQPLIWRWFFILMQITLISTRIVEHLTSFWYRGTGELGNGLLQWSESSFLECISNTNCIFFRFLWFGTYVTEMILVLFIVNSVSAILLQPLTGAHLMGSCLWNTRRFCSKNVPCDVWPTVLLVGMVSPPSLPSPYPSPFLLFPFTWAKFNGVVYNNVY